MKKLATLAVVFIATCNFSYSQIVDYYIPFAMTAGLDMTSGDVCTPPWAGAEEAKQSSIGNTWGGSWTSINPATPTSVKVHLYFTISDGTGPHQSYLNANADITHTTSVVSCAFGGLTTLDMDPSFYIPAGVNVFAIDFAASPVINQLDNIPFPSPPNCYIHVEVDYTPCNDPDIPVVTATPSTICPGGGSSTLTWTGDLNSATDWYIYSGSCGGTLEGTTTTNSFVVSPGATETYFIRGEGGCTTPGSCSVGTVVTVDDITAPVPDLSGLPPLSAECSITPAAPTATDNCAGALTGTPDVGFPITTQGTTTVTWTYDDGNGNTTTQIQLVTLDDVTPPVPDLASLPDATDECSVTLTAPTSTDNCVGAVTGTTTTSFPITTQGTTTVTWTYDDGNGNITTQMQDVIIDDVTPPTFSGCPSDQSVDADNAGCTAIVSWSDPTVLDNCTGATFVSSHSSPFTFPEGVTTVTYTATDVGGNTAVCSFDVTVTSTLTLSVDLVTDVACFGDATGAIDVTTSLGNPSYTWDWNSGTFSTESISGLTAGSYDLVATDAAGCTELVSVTVNEPSSALDVTVDASSDPSSCGGADGSIDVTTSGGTPAYAWDWDSGAFTTEDISGLSAGTYNLTATDANGCTFDVSVSLSDPGGPTISIDSIMDVSCFGFSDGTIDLLATGGTAPLSFDWDNDGTGDFDDAEDLTGVGAGTYSVVVQDAAGCSASISGTVNEPPMLDTSVSVAGYTLTATGAGLTYQWIDCADSMPIAGETNADFTVTANGSYAVVVSDGTCSDTSSCYTFADLGIDGFELEAMVYPNPVRDVLTIAFTSTNKDVNIVIADMSGKIHLSKRHLFSLDQRLEINLADFAPGIYILQLENAEGIYIQEIVKD